jgi:hypothetical protein
VKHRPRGLIAAQLEQALRSLDRDPRRLLRRHPPRQQEPTRQRNTGLVEYSPRRDRCPRAAARTQPVDTPRVPTFRAVAASAPDAVGPPQPLQVVQAVFLGGEPQGHLHQVPRVVPTTYRRSKGHKPSLLPLNGDPPSNESLQHRPRPGPSAEVGT